jgi:Mg-chelatase subunit ChlD
MGALHLVVMALAQAVDIRVVFAPASTAYTDGKTVVLPHLPVEADPVFLALVWGYIHHEAGHRRHSDFSLLPIVSSEGDPLLMHLFQVLEDVRMERAHIGLYPGAHRVLADLVEALVQLQRFKTPSPEDSPAHLAVGLVLKYLRWTVLNQPALELQARQHEALLEASLGPGVVSRLLALGEEVMHASSSADALVLARRIRQFLHEEQQKANTPPPATDGSDPEPTDGGNGDTPDADGEQESESQGPAPEGSTGNGSGKADEACDETGPSETDSSAEQAARSDGDKANDDGEGTEPINGPDGPMPEGADEALSSILSGAGLGEETEDLGKALSGLINDKADEQASSRLVLPEVSAGGHATRRPDLVNAARVVSARLASQMKRHLEGERRVPTVSMPRGTRLVRRHLTRVAFGDPHVFSKRLTQKSLNTSVVCLLDTSGSMSAGDSRPRVEIAREAMLATMMALQSLRNVEGAAAAFPGRGCGAVELLSDFDERPDDVSSRFAVGASGGTPMAEAILWASYRLSTRSPDRRKVIMVATDGAPNDAQATRQVIASAQRIGHEVYGLGIDCDDSYGIFPRFGNCRDVSVLCEAFMTLFFDVLKRRSA